MPIKKITPKVKLTPGKEGSGGGGSGTRGVVPPVGIKNIKPIRKKMSGPKDAKDLAKLKKALSKKTETKKVTKPDSPFLKFVEPKRKNTKPIQEALNKLKQNKPTPKNVVNLAEYKKRKFRGK